MRRFKLRNEGGTTSREYALQYTDAFLWEPSGLGFNYSRDYREVDGFFLTMSSAIAQTSKTGTIVFTGKDPYGDYKKFIDWIMASQKLKLMYAPKDTWYYMDIDVEEVQKSEIEQDGTLQCAIIMNPTSPIYLKDSKGFDIKGDLPTNMKKYTYTYGLGDDAESPYTEEDYYYVYSDTAVAGELIINAEAQLPCGIEIYTNTPVSAPVLSFYDGTKLIGLVDLSAVSVTAGDELLYSGLPTSAGVTITSGGVTTDISNLMGISATAPAYFMLPPNKDIRAVLSADSIRGVEIEIRVYRYFASI